MQTHVMHIKQQFVRFILTVPLLGLIYALSTPRAMAGELTVAEPDMPFSEVGSAPIAMAPQKQAAPKASVLRTTTVGKKVKLDRNDKQSMLMVQLQRADEARTRLIDLVGRIQMLRAQAQTARDLSLASCLTDREKRARELVEGADRNYQAMLKGITEEDARLLRYSLDMNALLPQLERQLVVQKDSCVGQVTGVFVEYSPAMRQ